MTNDIKISGTAKLVEVYENNTPTGIGYFAKLELGLEGGSRKIETDVRINKDNYNQLKQESDSSSAEETIIRVGGRLELKVESVCIN